MQGAFSQAMNTIDSSALARKRMQGWAAGPASLDARTFIGDVELVGKGRFAQRLASIIVESDLTECPDYILEGIKYVADKCRRN